jgi:hypothetical protein
VKYPSYFMTVLFESFLSIFQVMEVILSDEHSFLSGLGQLLEERMCQ